MPLILDELKNLVRDGREALAAIIDPLHADACQYCGGEGYEHLICPGCGKWDIRSDFDFDDEADEVCRFTEAL